MNDEILTTLDENGNITGRASREEVHREGYWHETFHCWFVGNDQGSLSIYLQLRSQSKKDFPGLLDITAAGHLLANETAEDGIREIEEELGLHVPYEVLIPLGIIPYQMIKSDLVDKERAHVYLYDNKFPMNEFKLQQEEVAGIVKARFEDFRSFWLGEQDLLLIEGFKVDPTGQIISIREKVDKTHFVPHGLAYYEIIIKSIELEFNK